MEDWFANQAATCQKRRFEGFQKKSIAHALNMANRMFCSAILERIKTSLDGQLQEEQAGFCGALSCEDQLATPRITVEVLRGTPPRKSTLQISRRLSIASAERCRGGCCATSKYPSRHYRRWYMVVRRQNH